MLASFVFSKGMNVQCGIYMCVLEHAVVITFCVNGTVVCVYVVDYTWTDYRMRLVISWHPVVYIVFQYHSVLNPTIQVVSFEESFKKY